MSLTTAQLNQQAAIQALQKGSSAKHKEAARSLCLHSDVDSLLALGAITHDQSYRAHRALHRTS
jgi:hypothetical protein